MSPVPEVAATGALALVTAGDAWLLDVREHHEWTRGHSPLATLVPMMQVPQRIDEIPRDVRVLVVCHSGQRSTRVTQSLVDAGYDAANVQGGMIAWNAAGGELVSGSDKPPRVD